MATNESPWEVLTYTCHTCGVTAPWGGRLLGPHLDHSSVRVACNGCRQSFADKTSALQHFKQHMYNCRGYQTPLRRLSADDIPPAPHNTPERSATSQASSSPEQNVLRPTLSPVVSPTAQSPTPSLQPAQQPRPRAPTPASSTGSAAAAAPGDLEYLRDKLRKTTRHLVWLASAVARLPNLHPDQPLGEFARELNTALAAPPTEPDINFRRELETDFPLTLDNPRTMSVTQIARSLLPVYESWNSEAKQ